MHIITEGGGRLNLGRRRQSPLPPETFHVAEKGEVQGLD